jgi:hypothetical protein
VTARKMQWTRYSACGHYDIFDSPQVALAVLPFLNGKTEGQAPQE